MNIKFLNESEWKSRITPDLPLNPLSCDEVDKISFTYERFSKFLSENQIPEKFRWFHSEGVVYVENRKGLINIPPYNKLKDFK